MTATTGAGRDDATAGPRAELAAVAALTPFAGERSWRDVLFAADGGFSRPDDPDRKLLAALLAEYPVLDRHAATLPERAHLDWLERILGIPRLPVLPDRVVARATVDPRSAPAVVERGTLLRGGKDATGAERRYATEEALTAHGAALVGVRTLVPGGPSPALPGLAGAAPEFPLDPHAGSAAPHRLRVHSPLLAFEGGSMTVELGFAGAAGAAGLAPALWHFPRPDGTEGAVTGAVSAATVTVVLTGGCTVAPGRVPWIEARIPDTAELPVDLVFERVEVKVVGRAVLPQAGFFNDGALDVTKEFQPFGAVAKRGDALYLRSDEAFGKPLAALEVTVEVLQEEGTVLSSAFGGSGVPAYLSEAVTREIEEFSRTSSVEDSDQIWLTLRNIRRFLAPRSGPSVHWQRHEADGWVTIATVENTFSGFGRTDLGGVSSSPSAAGGKQGHFVRAFLAEGDFGWTHYQEAVADFATKAVAGSKPTMPVPPVPPVCSRIALRYTTVAVPAERVEVLNGWARRVKLADDVPFRPFTRSVSDRGDTGMVAIGLGLPANAAGSTVSLYLDVDSAAPCDSTEDPDARWEWWAGGRWRPLAVTDGSSLLRESGLLRFLAPSGWPDGCPDADADTGRWIRLVTGSPQRIGGLQAVVPDAVTAAYVSTTATPELDPSSRAALPPGTIRGTVAKVAGVKKVTNLAGVAGREPESDTAYRRRASGLTRHRGRALTAWDYEELVSVAFPEVAAVRCLPHTAADGTRRPGSVGLVVLPDQPARPAPRPSVSLSGRIAEALAPRLPVHASPAVMCPLYVAATVDAVITLRPGFAALTGLREITAALETWLHPLNSAPVRWGVGLYRSSLVAFLDRLPWVGTLDSLVLSGPDGAPVQSLPVDACRGLYCSSALHTLDVREHL
ncbi:baseplate J/gp47 family protein [Streptomyces sp. SKN60]|uniref:baseplate J/gp47 family protein n=1 Tax=Streptomyces sp. SKN60 TaxID=2855506 RepID=UPI002247F131|nr:baseplate J/gp47 family protein [Streptomyces sp. SKN60]MCX2183921.1 baseplate J/gp47 family protein [Streptomyces sp. SKN60]